MKKLLIILALPVLMSGCASQIGMLSIASSKSTDLHFKDEAKASQLATGQGPTIDKAIIKALASAGPQYDALIDLRVDAVFYYAVLVSWYEYRVSGTPVKTSGVK